MATFVKHTPANAGASQRIAQLVEALVDPIEPPRFAHKKAPQNTPSPPAPVLQSPKRKPTAAERIDWEFPPVVSTWKTPRGYTIALDNNDASPSVRRWLAEFAETLYVADRTAREDVVKRARFHKSVIAREKEAKEAKLRNLAARAQREQSGIRGSCEEADEPMPAAGDLERKPPRPGDGGAAAFFDIEDLRLLPAKMTNRPRAGTRGVPNGARSASASCVHTKIAARRRAHGR